MRVDELNKAWEAASRRPIAAEMTFAGDFLVLGAQTRLAKIAAAPDEARLAALLAAAHGRPIAAPPLRHVFRAMAKWRECDKPLALTLLALSGHATLANPRTDARRLFVADALIQSGVDPSIIVRALGLGPAPLPEALDKYNPDQPRVPARNSDGGQWTSGDWEGASTAANPSPPFELAQADLDQTCSAFIAANCKASILRVFPGQFLDCTLRQVQAAAKEGDAAARTACKLLSRGIYRK
jgi:hypothetical protein